MRSPSQRRLFTWALGLLTVPLAAFPPAPATAQQGSCNLCPGAFTLPIFQCSIPGTLQDGATCPPQAGEGPIAPVCISCRPECRPPVVTGPELIPVPQANGSFKVRMLFDVLAPFNSASETGANATLDVEWIQPGNPFGDLCEHTASDHMQSYWEAGGFTCLNVPQTAGTVTFRASMCGGQLGSCCRSRTSVPNVPFRVTPTVLGCRPPRLEAPPMDAPCNATTGTASSVSVGGRGPGIEPPGSGPGAKLRYAAGGVGGFGYPGSADWNTTLGRYWSHDHAERIVLDPVTGDETHVWLLTRWGSFREFTDTDADGTYDQVSPADEYRTLRLLGTGLGWTLTALDGTVSTYRPDGRWESTADRNGNLTRGSYDGLSRLMSVTFPDGRSESFAYSSDGRLAAITEVGIDGTTQRIWTYTWTAFGDLLRIDRPDGTAWRFLYDDGRHPGYLTRMTLVGSEGGERVEGAWEYDDFGNVVTSWRGGTSSTGPGAADVWHLAYDDPLIPTVTTVTDPLGRPITYQLTHVTGKPVVTSISGDCPTCGGGPNQQIEYLDPQNPLRPTKITDGTGDVTAFEYDAHGQVTARIEALGAPEARTLTWAYHPTWPALPTEISRLSITGGPELRTTTLAYDASGNLTTRTVDGVEAGTALLLTTAFTHQANGQMLTTDPPGFGSDDVTRFTYDPARGDLLPLTRTDPLVGTTTFGYDAFNRRTTVTDPDGVTTETQYDALDQVRWVIQRAGTLGTDFQPGDPAQPGDLATETVYSEFGDLFRTILPRGNVIEYGYDAAARLTSIERKPAAATPGERTLFELDGAGNRIREELQGWDAGAMAYVAKSVTEFSYPNRCQMESLTRAPGTPEQSVIHYAYDCDGNLERVWDAEHPRFDPGTGLETTPTQTYAYDALERLTSITQPWAGAGGGQAVTEYHYDVQDHLTQVTDAEGNTTTYQYSDRDLMTRETSPVSGVTTFTYNDHGELIQTTDARAVTVTRDVDALDRVTAVRYPTTALDTTYTYDTAPAVCAVGESFHAGRLASITRHGVSLDFCYDRFGRLSRDDQLTYQYDANGNRTTVGYASGVMATYGFDFADRQQSLTVQQGANPPQTLVSSATYLPSGPLSSLTLGNGLTETRTFDGRYVPTGITVPSLLDWTYTTDGEGNILQITDNLTPSSSRTYGYQNIAYFLTQGNGPWGALSWSYDKIGNRLTETRDGATDTYSYLPNAAAGNTALLDHITLAVGGTRNYQYGPAGHLERVTAGANQILFTSDDEGRLARLERPASGASTPFTYDGRSFLTAAGAPAPIFADGFESGDFSCWSAVVSGPTAGTCPPPPPVPEQVRPVYSSDGLLHALGKGTTFQDLFYLAGRPVAQRDSATGALLYLTTDHLGTPVVATDGAGSEVWSGGFEPFGEDYAGAQAAGVFLRFPGQWEDAVWEEASLGAEVYYNVHRWYQPRVGRYTRTDPLGLRGGQNLYPYAMGNPLFFVDPLGLVVQRCCRNIEVNQYVDTASRIFGLQHCFIKTDTVEAGMGPADNGPLPACPIGVETAVVNHAGQSTEPGTNCVVVPDVDEECVNQLLAIGRPTGEWSPINQCNSFADGVLNRCLPKCPKPTPGFTPCHSFGCLGNR